MKTIIVPTDFSPNATKALRFAIQLANRFSAEVHLIHAYELHSRAGMLMNIRDFIRKDSEKQLIQVMEQVKGDLLYTASLKSKTLQGDAIDVISQYADNHNADIIVMGTKGASGLKEVFLGSNTEGLLKSTTKPVLAIPSDFSEHSFDKITLAVDAQVINELDVLEPLRQIAKVNEATVQVLHVEKENKSAVIDEGIDVFLADVKHDFHIIKHSSISAGIKAFNEETGANLLCMIRRKRNFLEKIFHTSITEEKAFHANIPLLVLQDRS